MKIDSTFYFYAIILSFLGGVAFASFVSVPAGVLFFLTAIFLSLVGIFSVISVQNKLFLLLALGCLCFLFGNVRYVLFRYNEGDQSLEQKVGEKVELNGIISEETQETENGMKSVVEISKNVHILLMSSFYPKLEYGDTISFSGKLKKPEAFETDSGRMFDYPSFLAKDKIFYAMSFAKVSVIDKNQGSKIIKILLSIKHSFVHHIQSVIPQPESNLLAGYLVEGKQLLSKDIQNKFKIAGIIHTVALSGYNVTIIVQAIMGLLSFLPKMFQLSGGIVGVLLFTLMTGASTTVVRAAIMALIAILAQSLRRSYNVSRALILAAFGMVLWNPMTLIFDPGFQLSFLATLGLVHLSPILAPHLSWLPEKLNKKIKLRETVTSTISAQLAVLPLLLYSSGQFSFVALPTNILILPTLPLTMMLGALTAGLSYLHYVVALPVGTLSYALLYAQLFLVHFFANLPYATVQIPFPWWLMLAVYAIGVFWLLRNYFRSLSN